MTLKHLSDANPEGTAWGQSTSDLLAAHGVSPCDQSPTAAAVTTTTVASTSGSPFFGFQTSDQGNAVITLVNAMRVCLREKGFMA